jgi:hypothetical protein
MKTIKAAQLIYGNVEKERSPTKVGGFQTLFHTKALLSEDEVEEIEEKLVYYQSENNPVKRLFFTLSGGKVVVARIVPVAGADKFGRTGSYLAHSIILAAADFIQAGGNPFTIFDLVGERFLNSADEALEQGGSQSGDIGELNLDIGKEVPGRVDKETEAEWKKWPAAELRKLAHYTIEYRRLKAKKEPLVLIGTAGQIEKTLRAALSFLPGKYRLECGFDTYFHDCNLARSNFWAVGYANAADAPPLPCIVDTSGRKIAGELPAAASTYEKWVRERITGKEWNALFNNSAAFELDRFLSDQEYDQPLVREALLRLPGDYFDPLAGLYNDPLKTKIKEHLERAIGEKSASRLLDKASENSISTAPPKTLFDMLINGFDLNRLADELYDIFRGSVKDTPRKQEKKELRALIENTAHKQLSLLMSLWENDYKMLTTHSLRLFDEGAGNVESSVFSSFLKGLNLDQVKGIKKTVKKQVKKKGLEVSTPFLESLDRRFTILSNSTKLGKFKGFVKRVARKLPFARRRKKN